jgi:hypothetical protein
MSGARVYGVAMSTTAGIRNVLAAVREQAKREDEVGRLRTLLGRAAGGIAVSTLPLTPDSKVHV